MGILNFFKNKETDYVGAMKEYLKFFMIQYINNFPRASDDVIPIFSNVELMIRNLSEKEVSKMMRVNNVNIECGVLNIIQNFAMTELKSKSVADYITGNDYVHDLYDYINNEKYQKGYISKLQFDENEMLGIKLSLNSPFGEWLGY